ncbi:MAG: 23S rRNA (pseudouridine(1915)-N(3))-methyltransferase RlmH [Gemmatimonadales bacterium]|nr:23S rRNA (pseudouridine(1915)-N(3))-methyltransferase RlmH [Gemmatimonadales bacterium]
MELVLVAVGKLRPFYREACNEYARRLSRYVRFAEHEVREASREPTLTAQQTLEARRIDARIPEGAFRIALSRQGHAWSSTELAGEVERWLLAARPVSLTIGGSTGLAPEFLARCAARWSLGPLTMPHELARVIVVEQLYRAFTILRGEPYHKGADHRAGDA